MAAQSKNSIVKNILSLRENRNIDFVVRVVPNKDNTEIAINLANRKYVGRIQLKWDGEQFLVYLVDKISGIAFMDDRKNSKGAYMKIATARESLMFVKWYELTTQLAALTRTRAA